MDYKEEIRIMCAKYDDETKQDLRAVLNDLYNLGFGFDWIYCALSEVESRSGGYGKWRNLLFYKDFQQEITNRINKAKEKKKESLIIGEAINKQIEALKNREVIEIVRKPKPRKSKKEICLDELAAMED